MSKTICIYSKERDKTTDFLAPLCKHICDQLQAVCVGYDVDSEEDSVAIIYQSIQDADSVIFLGHGDSTGLYASVGDDYKLFDAANIDLLRGKRLFLMACNSADLIKRFHLENALGFGNLPTSIDDVQNWKVLHSVRIEDFIEEDIKFYDDALINILDNVITPETMADYNLLYDRIKFQTSVEIAKCLTQHKHTKHYREIADLLFYMQKDIRIQ